MIDFVHWTCRREAARTNLAPRIRVGGIAPEVLPVILLDAILDKLGEPPILPCAASEIRQMICRAPITLVNDQVAEPIIVGIIDIHIMMSVITGTDKGKVERCPGNGSQVLPMVTDIITDNGIIAVLSPILVTADPSNGLPSVIFKAVRLIKEFIIFLVAGRRDPAAKGRIVIGVRIGFGRVPCRKVDPKLLPRFRGKVMEPGRLIKKDRTQCQVLPGVQ